MEKKITWQEAYKDYFNNFFRPKAPITEEMYDKHRWITLLISTIGVVLFILVGQQLDLFTTIDFDMPLKKYHELKVNESFVMGIYLTILIFFLQLPSLPSEIRMFYARKKKPTRYLMVLIGSLVASLLFVFSMYKMEQMNTDFLVLIFFSFNHFFSNDRALRKEKTERLRKEY
ncbi:hypothetical protein [Macrococcus carouselicus]|uniref:Uncharacterized protein n=1 Tax=Macrococcus carouselicus TaxID=69969 RepID=A0A9Q8CM10_9STAP|nr:hypothetical protein [Macrococcus carouselicus]TDM04496.1 hypothetical protein ERX40_04815 [Macrococcus carouselicus]